MPNCIANAAAADSAAHSSPCCAEYAKWVAPAPRWFDAVGEPVIRGSFSLNGTRYSTADVGVLEGEIDFRKFAPYLGHWLGQCTGHVTRLAFRRRPRRFHQGSARVALRSVNCTVLDALCRRLAEDVAAEQRRLAGEVSDYKLYPVLRASLSYAF